MRRLLILIAIWSSSAPLPHRSAPPTTSAQLEPTRIRNRLRTVAECFTRNQASLAPGDTVLFAGGQQFTDSTLTPSSSGTSSAPIKFGSYGTGRAVLHAGPGTDIYLPSGSHDFVFDNLELTGSGILFLIRW